jgi:tetratricopeptide repeat protein
MRSGTPCDGASGTRWSVPADKGHEAITAEPLVGEYWRALGTVPNVGALSREEFDAIEFDAAASGNHEAAAQRMSTLAVTGTQTDSMPRAEAFLRAGEQWLLADDPDAAANGFRMAMADGGPAFVDPRVPLARALFQLGRNSEAYDLIGKLKSEGRNDPRVCDLIAELLVDRADLQEALDWATAGVELCLRGRADASAPPPGDSDGQPESPAAPVQSPRGEQPDDEAELLLLLRLRYRIRYDLGLPEDSYDQLLGDA